MGVKNKSEQQSAKPQEKKTPKGGKKQQNFGN